MRMVFVVILEPSGDFTECGDRIWQRIDASIVAFEGFDEALGYAVAPAPASLSVSVCLAFLVDHPDQQIGVRFQPLPQHHLYEVRPADLHFGGDGIERVFCGRFKRQASDVPQHQGSAAKDNLQIRARHVADPIGTLKFFGDGMARQLAFRVPRAFLARASGAALRPKPLAFAKADRFAAEFGATIG